MEEEEEATKKRGVEDEIDEEKTVKFLRKLGKKERKKREREGDQEDACADEVGEKLEKGAQREDSCETRNPVTTPSRHDCTVTEIRAERRVNGFVVNEAVMEVDVDDDVDEEWMDDDELGLALVEEGRREEVEFMVDKLDMFEFGTYEEAVKRGGKVPATTKWLEGWKMGEDGKRFVRCRLVGRDFKGKEKE